MWRLFPGLGFLQGEVRGGILRRSWEGGLGPPSVFRFALVRRCSRSVRSSWHSSGMPLRICSSWVVLLAMKAYSLWFMLVLPEQNTVTDVGGGSLGVWSLRLLGYA